MKKLKNEFNNLQEKVDDLEKLNQELDRQHNLDLQENIQENINNEMNKALEELEKNNFTKSFLKGKLEAMKYFFSYELPKTNGLAEIMMNMSDITIKKEEDYIN